MSVQYCSRVKDSIRARMRNEQREYSRLDRCVRSDSWPGSNPLALFVANGNPIGRLGRMGRVAFNNLFLLSNAVLLFQQITMLRVCGCCELLPEPHSASFT
jgi:hypothetical protein